MTDLAARGIDIPLLNNVIHYDFPPSMKLFIHRSGRTARAGQSGRSFTLITNHELPYLIDSGVYVGRKYVWNIKDLPEEEQKDAIENPLITLYGKIPQTTLDSYNEEVKVAYERNWILENNEKSMNNAMIKYKKFKNSASQESVLKAKEMGEVGIHPIIAPKVNIEEQVLMNLQSELKTFRPKLNAIECMYTKNKQVDELEKFQKIIKNQNKELTRKEVMQRVREQAQKELDQIEEYTHTNISLDNQIAEKPKPVIQTNKTKLSKHDRKRMRSVRSCSYYL